MGSPRIPKPLRRETGFTYIGLLLGVALVGVFLAAAGTLWSTTVQREREARLIAVGLEFQRALQSYYDASPGIKRPPSRLEDLLEDKRLPVIRRHLRRIYDDPMTGRADWVLVRTGDAIVGVHSRSERTPFRQFVQIAPNASAQKPATYRDWVFAISASSTADGPGPGAAAASPGSGLPQANAPVASESRAQALPAPQPPASEEVAKRRECNARFESERQQCMALIATDRRKFGLCQASAANRLNACQDGIEGPPLAAN